MEPHALQTAFARLSTPLLADACLRLRLPVQVAPAGLRPVVPGQRLAGRVRPVQHFGSVDVFLEAIHYARPGDVLVVDNQGRTDEACVGDLTALEARIGGLSGLLVWGLHRDTAELDAIGFPVFSYGALPTGPLRLDAQTPSALQEAKMGDHCVTADDVVFADADGAVFVPFDRVADVLAAATEIQETERAQAEAIAAGTSLREALHFADYLARRADDPAYTFRHHLRHLGGAIEA